MFVGCDGQGQSPLESLAKQWEVLAESDCPIRRNMPRTEIPLIATDGMTPTGTRCDMMTGIRFGGKPRRRFAPHFKSDVGRVTRKSRWIGY
jgi:hypothetical protein